MTEEGVEALVLSVNKSINELEGKLEDVQGSLDSVQAKLGKLPENYIPRKEAVHKAKRARQLLGTFAGLLLILAGFVFWTEDRAMDLCKDDRSALRSVIEIAIADRQPLPTSSPETITALERDNATRIRPLRERLLSLDGTQPEKC